MKISKKDILVTSCDLGKNKQDQAYVNLQFIDMEDGMSYQIISKDIDLMNKVKKMTKYKVDLELTSSKYGLKLNILSVLEELGTV